jgi:hypothetical protein
LAKKENEMSKPILCVDFDGVIHSYSSGWKGADVIPDPPVEGVMQFIWDATDYFRVAIFSSRSNQSGGLSAMKAYLRYHFKTYWGAHAVQADDKLLEIEWPLEKPAAFLTIDDRAICFEGDWSELEPADLLNFKPWNKRSARLGATGDFPKGKTGPDDEGALMTGIAWDGKDGIVRIDFGKKVAWLGMEPPEAIEFAKAIIEKAGAKKIEIEF